MLTYFCRSILLSILNTSTTIMGSNVTYSNTKSGLSSTNVQGAIDELYEKADAGKVINKADKFVAAYTYNQISGASNYCVTGKEVTCQKTTCYKAKIANSCEAGTIIKYKVNDTTIVNFHVMFDNGNTMTMQSQRNTINQTRWVAQSAYIAAGGTEAEFGSNGSNTKGPLTILPILEKATSGWSNVNDQTYTLGTTSLSGKGAQTGCSTYNSCTTNTYTLASRTTKARLITLQEIASLGCNTNNKSCPVWMYNYLNGSTSNGGTENDTSGEYGYWSSSAYSSYSDGAGSVSYYGCVDHGTVDSANYGVRAVVEVTK